MGLLIPEQQRDMPNVRDIMEINDIWYLPNKIKVSIVVALF
jgi:hypothetical protein